MLLLELAALTLVAAIAARWLHARPSLWDRPGAPNVAFAAALVLQLGWLAWLHGKPLHLDVDTARQIELLAASPTLGEVVRMRGVWAADYILQGPLLHGLRRVVGQDALLVHRLLTFGGAIAGAWLLREIARRLGAGPWTSLLAGLLPIASFGGAWLVLTLDDNVVASALQWAFFLALLGTLAGARRGDRTPWRALGTGLLLGIAVSFHRKALLFAPLLVAAPLLGADFRRPVVLRALAVVGLGAVAVHGLAAVLFLPDGIAANLASLVRSPHHAHPAWWTPAGSVDLVSHAGLILDGLRGSLSVFAVLSEPIWGPGPRPTDVFVLLFIAGGAAAVWHTRTDPDCRLVAVALAVQILHSLLYEPYSVERWDVVVAGTGVLGAVAVAGGGTPAWTAAWLAGMLLALQHLCVRWHPAF